MGKRAVWRTVGAAVLVVCAPTLVLQAIAAPHSSDLSHAPSDGVAIVLGASARGDRPSTYLRGRLEVARQLYAAGKVRAILVSGDNQRVDYDEPTTMQRWLVEHGVPEGRVVRDHAGFDTYDTCVRAKEIFGVRRALVVSQGYHVPRAVATCRLVGIDAHGVGDAEVASPWTRTWAFGVAREVPAAWKATFDLMTHRRPVLGQHETGVEDALRRP